MDSTGAPFDLQRLVVAQDAAPDFLSELRTGHKRSHWMWFVFPQVAGLGHSSMAQRYAIASLDEARAYLRTPCSVHGCSSACTPSTPTRATPS